MNRVAVGLALALGVGLAWWIWFDDPSGVSETRPDLAQPEMRPAPTALEPALNESPPIEPTEVAATPDRGAEPRESGHEGHTHSSSGSEASGDADFYLDHPMSPIPHQVARGWGARRSGKQPGVVGVFVIVNPAISDTDLERLARDIHEYHYDAEALSARILDSFEAATYDRHSDGGELASKHLVGLVNLNERLGVDHIQVRGRTLDPDHPSETTSD